jgi:phosphoglycolate phosphatase
VVDCVRVLSARIPVFVVSNCQDGYIELTLAKTGLADFVKDYECFGRTGLGKADNLRLLMERNALASPVYVGDTQGDCDACAEAGVPFVWAAYGFGTADSCFAKIDRFPQVEELFA